MARAYHRLVQVQAIDMMQCGVHELRRPVARISFWRADVGRQREVAAQRGAVCRANKTDDIQGTGRL